MLPNYSDEEITRYVDRKDPVVDELCRRLEKATENAVATEGMIVDLKNSIEDIQAQLETREAA